ncbi:MAG TPA: antibiotic biosynthesis monooxygenase family protein [Bacteroidia bacterium]|jgi:heme-degrading monooxygenase HmoA|nr:antibiotic biosynthesis monooxygenase family protein [Bacteroidia bacterium]
MPWKKIPPQKDYYAVIFASTKSGNIEGYKEMDDLTLNLAQEQPGFLGYESVNNGNSGIFISYWENMQAIGNWRQHSTHLMAKAKADQWYKRYLSQICKVEHSHLMEK